MENKPVYQIIHEEKMKQRIRDRAYEIYEWRIENGIGGNATTDWFDAEQDILEQLKNDNLS